MFQAVCLLDTGVNRAHILIEPTLAETDMAAVRPEWGLAGFAPWAWHGHGRTRFVRRSDASPCRRRGRGTEPSAGVGEDSSAGRFRRNRRTFLRRGHEAGRGIAGDRTSRASQGVLPCGDECGPQRDTTHHLELSDRSEAAGVTEIGERALGDCSSSRQETLPTQSKSNKSWMRARLR